jgi:hypothetical protein
MGTWGTQNKQPAVFLNQSLYPALWWEASNQTVYCFGQHLSDLWVYAYDLVTDTWSQFIDVGAALTASSQQKLQTTVNCRSNFLFISNGFMYVNVNVAENTGVNNRIYKFNLATKAYISNALTVSTDRKHKTILKNADNRIFLIDWFAKILYEWISVNESFTNCGVVWPNTYVSVNSNTIGGPEAFTLDRDIFIMGGYDYNNDGNVYRINVSNYSTTSYDQFPDINGVQTCLDYHVAIPVGNYAYILGGQMGLHAGGSSMGACMGYVYKFDPQATVGTQWTQIAAHPTFKNAGAVSCIKNGYIIGGEACDGTDTYLFKEFTYFLDKPTNLTGAYDAVTGNIDLTWIDVSGEEDYYVVERMRDDETVFSIMTTPYLAAGSTTWTDTTIDIMNHFYTYRVRCLKVI